MQQEVLKEYFFFQKIHLMTFKNKSESFLTLRLDIRETSTLLAYEMNEDDIYHFNKNIAK